MGIFCCTLGLNTSVNYDITYLFSLQPGLKVTPKKWFIPQTAGDSSVDSLGHLWSKSPNGNPLHGYDFGEIMFKTKTKKPQNNLFLFFATGRNLSCSTSTSWNVPVLWSCWSSSVPPHRSVHEALCPCISSHSFEVKYENCALKCGNFCPLSSHTSLTSIGLQFFSQTLPECFSFIHILAPECLF